MNMFKQRVVSMNSSLMATGGETKLSCCSACIDDGRNTVARHYCVDCEMFFCTKCVKSHKTIPVLRKHQVNDVNSSDVTDVDVDITERGRDSAHSLRCTLHQDKFIDSYCKDHDEICCGTCAVAKHRSCTTISIAIAAKDFKSSPDLNMSKKALDKNIVQCKHEKKKRTDNLEGIGKQKQELLENVNQYEEKIIAKIKELANASRNEIRAKYEKHKTAIETEIDVLDAVITTNTTYVDKIEQIDDEQLFVYVKINKTVTTDGEMLFQAMTIDWTKKELTFDFDKQLENCFVKRKSFGRLEEECAVKLFHAVFERSVDVRQLNDYQNVQEHDMCLLDSRDVLLADYNNKKLKRFNSDLQFIDEILLSGHPVAVCTLSKSEVAVRIRNTKIVHIVSVDQSMQLTSSFKLADNGLGMACDSGTGEIFACENDKVSVYSKTGNQLRAYNTNIKGRQLQCKQIALSMKNKDMYVIGCYKELIVVDKSGHLKMQVSISSVRDIWPLCLLPGHICLTVGKTPGVIVQINKDGKQVGNLIDTNNGRTDIFCCVYDHEQSRLLVGGASGVISVYTMSAESK